MRCLLVHKWVTEPRYLNMLSARDVAYRKCKRCGKTQFGVVNDPSVGIRWSPIRKGSFSDAREARMRRRPSSWLDQIAHSLRLSRTRETDRSTQEYARR